MSKIWYKLPAIIYTIFIFILSSFPLDSIPKVDILNFDKFVHFIEYAVYGILLIIAFMNTASYKIAKNAVVISLLVGIAYGGSDEIHQLFVVGRSTSIFDFTADAFGVCAGVIIFTKFKYYKVKSALRDIHSEK